MSPTGPRDLVESGRGSEWRVAGEGAAKKAKPLASTPKWRAGPLDESRGAVRQRSDTEIEVMQNAPEAAAKRIRGEGVDPFHPGIAEAANAGENVDMGAVLDLWATADGDADPAEAVIEVTSGSSFEVCVVGGIFGIEDALSYLDLDRRRSEHPDEELDKLDLFQCFVPELRSHCADVKVFRHLWVDTETKARLTLQDLKREAGDSDEVTHVPTPAAEANACMEFLAALYGWPMVIFDIVSAFPHATEAREDVFMDPPPEWLRRHAAEDVRLVLRMLQ